MATDDYGRSSSSATIAPPPGVDPDNPAIPHAHYEKEKERRDLVRMLWDGTEAVREAGADALLPFADEDETSDNFVERSQLGAVISAMGEAVDVTVGLLTMQEPTFGADMRAELKAFWENVDGRKQHGAVFSTQLLTDGMLDARVGIFTEMARIVDRKSLDAAQARALGIRPWWIEVTADDYFQAIYEPVNGEERLVLFIRREIAEVRFGFALVNEYRYHVYEDDNGTITARTYVAANEREKPTLVPDSLVALEKQTEIPWSPLETGRRMKDGSLSPQFLELAYSILEHHEIKTGRLWLNRKACASTLVAINAPKNPDGTDPDIETGATSVIHARFGPGETIPEKPVYYLQPDVAVLQPSKEMLDDCKQEIVIAGGRHLAPDKKGVEAAKSKELDNRSRNASISRIARRWQDCLERAFGHVSAYMGFGALAAGSVTVSMRFEEALMEPEAMNAWAKLVEGGLDPLWAVKAMKMQGRLPADANEEQIAAEWRTNIELKAQQQAVEDELDRQEREDGGDPAGDPPRDDPEGGA